MNIRSFEKAFHALTREEQELAKLLTPEERRQLLQDLDEYLKKPKNEHTDLWDSLFNQELHQFYKSLNNQPPEEPNPGYFDSEDTTSPTYKALKQALIRELEQITQWSSAKRLLSDVDPALALSIFNYYQSLKTDDLQDDIIVHSQIYHNYQQHVFNSATVDNDYLKRSLKQLLYNKYGQILGLTLADIERDLRQARDRYLSIGDRKTLHKASDLLASDEPEETYLVDRLLTSSGLYLLAAAPKSYKSLLCYHLAYSVVHGTPFLNRFAVRKGKVLYVQCEESKTTIKNRLQSSGFSGQEDDLIILRFFDLDQDIEHLKELIHEHRPSLIIFDTLRAITSNSQISENTSEYARYLYRLQSICNTNNITGLVIHHKNKSSKTNLDAVSGTLALAGATDGVLLLSPAKIEGRDGLVMKTIPRSLPPTQLAITYGGKIINSKYRFVFEFAGTVTSNDNEQVQVDASIDDAEEAIERLIQQHDFLEFDQIVSSLHQFPRYDLERAWTNLSAFGLVKYFDKGYVWHTRYLELCVQNDVQDTVQDDVIDSKTANLELEQGFDDLELDLEPIKQEIKRFEPDYIEYISNSAGIEVKAVRVNKEQPETLDNWLDHENPDNVDPNCPVEERIVLRLPSKVVHKRVEPLPPPICAYLQPSAEDYLVYFRRDPNRSDSLEYLMSRVFKDAELLSAYILRHFYKEDAIQRYLEQCSPSKRALYRWVNERLDVFLEKDYPFVFNNPALQYGMVPLHRGNKTEPTPHQKMMDVLHTVSLGFFGYEFNYHRVAPYPELFEEFHPLGLNRKHVFPLSFGRNHWVKDQFEAAALKIWPKEVVEQLLPYAFPAESDWVDSNKCLTQSYSLKTPIQPVDFMRKKQYTVPSTVLPAEDSLNKLENDEKNADDPYPLSKILDSEASKTLNFSQSITIPALDPSYEEIHKSSLQEDDSESKKFGAEIEDYINYQLKFSSIPSEFLDFYQFDEFIC